MARFAKTFTIGTVETNVSKTDITTHWSGGYLICSKDNSSDIWVSLNTTAAPTVEGDDCFPVAPGERVAVSVFPIRAIASTAGNKMTVSPV